MWGGTTKALLAFAFGNKTRQRQHARCVLTKEMETTQALRLERRNNNSKSFAKEMKINQALGLERK